MQSIIFLYFQKELDKLNQASTEINRLENELDVSTLSNEDKQFKTQKEPQHVISSNVAF